MIQHAAMEPHSAHAQFDKESGRLTIWVANDAPFRALHEISEALGMPKEKIRFINPLQGGGFGSKGGLKVEPIAVACHDVRLSEVAAGEFAVVIGGGPIGALGLTITTGIPFPANSKATCSACHLERL